MDLKKYIQIVLFVFLSAVILLRTCISLPAASPVHPVVKTPTPDDYQPAVIPVSAISVKEQTVDSKRILSEENPAINDEAAWKEPDSSFISLSSFSKAVEDGTPQIKGLYAANLMSFWVVQQPVGKDSYISPTSNVATQFRAVSHNNSIGMLAHNFAAGAAFARLKIGDRISVIYGDGNVKGFKVAEIRRYQALQPDSTSSSFMDLASHDVYSTDQIFSTIYGGKTHLTLQTCITRGTTDTWGRLFVLAYPVE
jgi:hypothetical protein